MGRPADPVRYLLRTEVVVAHLDRRHLLHREVARRLQVSPGHWSQLVHRHRHLSPRMRDRILACGLFRGMTAASLWERVDGGAR